MSDSENEVWATNHFQVIQCLGCKDISFRKLHYFSEYTDTDQNGNEFLIEDVNLFPCRLTGRKTLEDSILLPGQIQFIYAETCSAIANSLVILAGAGIRALIEVVCKDKEATGKRLEDQIDNLVAQGVLTKDGASILHSLRIMGNKSIHEVKPLNKRDLNTALDVVEHLLLGVYILPSKTNNFPKRRELK
jgi:hypothetical protein